MRHLANARSAGCTVWCRLFCGEAWITSWSPCEPDVCGDVLAEGSRQSRKRERLA